MNAVRSRTTITHFRNGLITEVRFITQESGQWVSYLVEFLEINVSDPKTEGQFKQSENNASKQADVTTVWKRLKKDLSYLASQK